ncbi:MULTISPECIES: amidohydrolase family protein [unclassified Nocardioides]|uniref:amidohydrolase family protein n=1 Tax=unclassified Nocardioides TaxID=2615069 RepID=UPI00360C535D
MGTVVDVHCHNFNGDDLPVRGFVRDVKLEGKRLGDAVATLVDRVVQAKAPDYEQELRRLDALLGDALRAPETESVPGAATGEDTAVRAAVVPDLESRVRSELREMAASDPYLLDAAAAELEETAGDTLVETEGIGDFTAAAARAMRWATIYASSRLDVTVHMVRQFGDSVDLFTPMLVDLEFGLNDRAKTSILHQVILQERISRLSMLGRLPGVKRARIHPFVGFDPRREALTELRKEPVSALEDVQRAVTRYGFVGVKLYPPMGFRPLNNATKPGGPPGQDGVAVDRALRRLYQWCLEEDVPVTAHCNISNGARDAYDAFSDPDDWKTVLQEFPGLHLNLGHFGGMHGSVGPTMWPHKIAALARREDDAPGRNLYADVGNHRTDKKEFRSYMEQLRDVVFANEETRTMADRLMYGSDWYMLAILPNVDDFMADYRGAYAAEFGANATDEFMGERALAFLGFDDPKNKNAVRLRERYERYAPHRMPAWLATG